MHGYVARMLELGGVTSNLGFYFPCDRLVRGERC